MRTLICILCACAAVIGASAQTRNYSSNASGTFVFGLDSYFFGESGVLDFELDGETHQARVSGGEVSVDDTLIPGEKSGWETVIGLHDFTGDRVPELMVARRAEKLLVATVYCHQGGCWHPIGQMSVRDAQEIRVFRQVVSVRRGEALYSWTWHGNKFDFKASDGSAEPTSL